MIGPADTGRKLKVLCTFNLRPVSTGVHFVLSILFALTLASVRAVLYGNVALPILVLSAKKRYSSFFENLFQS